MIVYELEDEIMEKDADTGITTDDYVNAVDFHCSLFDTKTIMLKNTHASNPLKFRANGRIGGTQLTLVSETELLPLVTTKIISKAPLGVILVDLKSSSAGNHATYSIDWTGVMD